MKSSHDENWQKLVALARQAPVNHEVLAGAPLGFSTRIAARAFIPGQRGLAGLFEPLALRALSIAGVLAVVACAVNLSPVVQAVHDEIAVFERDPVSSVLEL